MKRNRMRPHARLSLGNFLREKRESRSLTQLEVAARMGYSSPQFVSNWERGLARPPADRLKVLSKVLTIDRKELINFLVELDRKDWEAKL